MPRESAALIMHFLASCKLASRLLNPGLRAHRVKGASFVRQQGTASDPTSRTGSSRNLDHFKGKWEREVLAVQTEAGKPWALFLEA